MKRFSKELIQNKKALFGLLIIVFYSAIGIFAPLLTPYDPTRSEDWGLAGALSAPEWFMDLGLGANLSKNLRLENYFSAPDETLEWTFSSTAVKDCFMQSISGVGNPDGSGPGSIAITYERQEQEPPQGKVYAYIRKQFDFPFDGHPNRILIKMAVSVLGTTAKTGELDIPVDIRIFLERIEENRTVTYSLPAKTGPEIKHSPVTSIPTLANWQLFTSDSSMLSAELRWITIERDVFPRKGKYVLCFEVAFNDLAVSNRRRKTTALFDDLEMRLYGTSWGLLGTDQLGRDVFTQFMHGARISLIVGLLSAVLSVTIGLFFGLTAGYLGGLTDEIMMRFNDMLLVLPGLPLLIVLMAVLGPSMWNIILLLGLLGWNGFARVVRSQTLSLKERPFIEAAVAIGASKFYIIRRHIVPNVMALVYITLATSVPGAIVAEAALSWLGLFDPHRMSWGRILRDINATPGAAVKWWWMLPPGLSIAALSVAFILIGYGLDEILNPKLRERR